MRTFPIIFLQALLIAGVLSGLFSTSAMAQHCECDLDISCCSRYGYCGTGDAYCGNGCQKGLCYKPCEGTGSLTVSDIVTQKFWDHITSKVNASCDGYRFYSRSAFLDAASAYPEFGTTCTDDHRKREVAAYFAHVTVETGKLCHVKGTNGTDDNYCQESEEYPCNPKKKYFGRGPLQLSWNYNYIDAGQDIGFDGLNRPEIVAIYPILSFQTSLWFWIKRGVHYAILSADQGICKTIRIISGDQESDDKNQERMVARLGYYVAYCARLGVSAGIDFHCLPSNLSSRK